MPNPFQCVCCGRVYDTIPVFCTERPDQYWDVPEEDRETNVFLTSDSCVIASRFFFVRGCIEIPIIGREDIFGFGVWVSLSKDNFLLWQDNYDTPKRRHIGPFFGWLCTRISVYPDTMSLKTMVHMRDDGIRPFIELENCDHPLAVDQHHGITLDRVMKMIHQLEKQYLDSKELS
jgi:hypothetical protein